MFYKVLFAVIFVDVLGKKDRISPECCSICASSCHAKSPYSYIKSPYSYILALTNLILAQAAPVCAVCMYAPVCAVEIAVFFTSGLTVRGHYLPAEVEHVINQRTPCFFCPGKTKVKKQG